MVSHPGKTITIYNVAEVVGKADKQALTPRTIRSGFAASSLWPFNRNVFAEDEFLSLMSRTGPTVAPMIAIQPLRQKTY